MAGTAGHRNAGPVPDEIPARSALHELADRYGVATRYENADQVWVDVEIGRAHV